MSEHRTLTLFLIVLSEYRALDKLFAVCIYLAMKSAAGHRQVLHSSAFSNSVKFLKVHVIVI